MKEKALLMGPHHSLVGVYTDAGTEESTNNNRYAVIFLNAGLTHHVGPHRLHVKLARKFAEQGFSSLRLDLSGIGDSNVSQETLPAHELAIHELTEIMDDLEQYGHTDFILFGICSGAKLALQIAPGDPRVKGLVVINQSLAADDPELQAQISASFYLQRSMWNPKAWLNLFTGKVNYKTLWQSLTGIIKRKHAAGDNKTTSIAELFHDELSPVVANNKRLLVLLSDRHVKFINLLDDKLQALQGNELLQISAFPQADHLFSLLEEQNTLMEHVLHWSEQFKPAKN